MSENTSDKLKEIGSGFFDAGKYKEAIEYFTKAININLKDAEAYDLRAVAWCRLLDFDKGILDLKTAISVDSQFHLAFSHLGEIAFTRKDFGEAEFYYIQALHISPENYSYLANLANTKRCLKKYSEALKLCEEIIKNYPDDKWAIGCRAGIYMAKEKYLEAIKDYIRLSESDRNNAVIYNNIGFAYSRLGIIDKARNNLRLCIKLKPSFAYAYNNLGYVYYLEDNYKKALELINTSLELDPSNSYAFKNRALVYIIKDDLVKAKNDLHKALQLGFTNDYGDEVQELLKGIEFLE